MKWTFSGYVQNVLMSESIQIFDLSQNQVQVTKMLINLQNMWCKVSEKKCWNMPRLVPAFDFEVAIF